MDYCSWKANCVVLEEDKKREGLDRYICCHTCPKKNSCWCACKDRCAGKICDNLKTKEELEKHLAPKTRSLPVETGVSKPSKREVEDAAMKELMAAHKLKQQQLKAQQTTFAVKAKQSDLSEKSLTKKLPKTVKELAEMTGATYARASYLIHTKKLSYSEALKKLQEK